MAIYLKTGVHNPCSSLVPSFLLSYTNTHTFRAIDKYEYVFALAGLKYMINNECLGDGYNKIGSQLYTHIQPVEGGTFQIGLYSDELCIELNNETAQTYDDFAEVSELDLGSKDATDDKKLHQQAYLVGDTGVHVDQFGYRLQ